MPYARAARYRRFLNATLLAVTVLVAASAAISATATASATAEASAPTAEPAARRATSPTNLYVSPQGSDRAPGTRARPWRTLQHARNVVRNLAPRQRGDIHVYLLGGTHRLARSLVLTAADSGRNGHRIVWQAAPGARPVISGATRVRGWRVDSTALRIFKARVPKGTASRQLFVNGARATRAQGVTYPLGFKRTPAGYQAPDASMAAWRRPGDLEAVTYTQWKSMRCPVASIQGQEITMVQPCWTNANVFPAIWSFQLITRWENAYELLDAPGEWYLDGAAGWLYYIPLPGQEIGSADVELPTLQALVDVRGTATKPVRNISFEGLRFRYATWLDPSGSNGYAADQSGFHLNGEGHQANAIGHDPNPSRTPGNVRLRYARGVRFTGNDFAHLGGVGLDFATGSQRNEIVGNTFEDISSAAVQLGGVLAVDHHPPGPAQLTHDNRISNNLIQNIGVDYPDAAGIFAGFTTRTTISNNDIDNVPWSGIAIGWGWGLFDPGGFPGVPGATAGMWGTYTTPTASSGNRILSNCISNFLQTLWDGGAIYTLGQQGATAADGETISGNVAFDKRRLAGGNVFYTDGGSRYVTLTNNVSYNNPVGITDFGPCYLPDSLPACFVLVPYGTDRGGCRPYGDINYVDNYWQFPDPYWIACVYPPHPVNVSDSGSAVITGPSQVPSKILRAAGRQGRYRD